MREEVRKIISMVEEGKIAAGEAIELIDAMERSNLDSKVEAVIEEVREDEEEHLEELYKSSTKNDPFRTIVEAIEWAGREASGNFSWDEIKRHIKSSTRKGVAALKVGMEEVSKKGAIFAWIGPFETRELRLPLSVKPGGLLTIENPYGDIKIRGGVAAGTLDCTTKFYGTPEDAKLRAKNYALFVEEQNGDLLIKQPDLEGIKANLDIEVPEGVRIQVVAVAGDIKVTKTLASVDIRTNGDVNLRQVEGRVNVNTRKGDIELDRCDVTDLVAQTRQGDIKIREVHGPARACTVSGDISYTQSSGSTVSIESVSGDLKADVDAYINGVFNMRTVSGDAQLLIPDGGDCRVSLSTVRGDVRCEIPLVDSMVTEHSMTGKLGPGTGTLDVSVVTGDVALKLRDQGTIRGTREVETASSEA